jgi:hypothetical protein
MEEGNYKLVLNYADDCSETPKVFFEIHFKIEMNEEKQSVTNSLLASIKNRISDLSKNIVRSIQVWKELSSNTYEIIDDHSFNWLTESLLQEIQNCNKGGKKQVKNRAQKPATPFKKTKETIKVGNKTRLVYVGPRGGKYVKWNGAMKSVKSLA